MTFQKCWRVLVCVGVMCLLGVAAPVRADFKMAPGVDVPAASKLRPADEPASDTKTVAKPKEKEVVAPIDAPPVAAASVPVAPPPLPVFVLRKGDEIGVAVAAWCAQVPDQCGEVSWGLGRLVAQTDFTAQGVFLDAVQALVRALDAGGVRLRPVFHKQNKVLRVTEG